MSAQANKINFISLSVVKYLAIRVTLADSVLDVGPKMRFGRNGLLQAVGCFVIGSFAPERIPGDLGFIQSKSRQHMQQVQLRLILLRERQRIVERQL